jgi:hypothetical protein
MGLSILGEGDRRLITHGGGINGFLSDGRFYPERDLVIIVLQNSTGPQGPGALSRALAEAILGPEPELASLPFQGELDALTGSYSGPGRGPPMTLEVTQDGEGLVVTPQGSTNEIRPLYLGDLTWGLGNTRMRFIKEGNRISELRLDQGSGHYVLARKEEG